MAVKRSVSQADFDEAVAANIEAFGMSEEEAFAAAMEEFEIQGADLTGIITSLEAKVGIEGHPIVALTEDLHAAWSSNAGAAAAVESLKKFLCSLKSEELLRAVTVSEKEKTICKLLKILASSGCDNHLVSNCLHAQSLLLTTDQNRRQFFLDKGAAVVGAMCIRNPEDVLIQAAAAKVAEAACTKCEDNKDAFMAVDIGNIFSKSLSAQTSSDEVVRAVSRAVVRLTTADDDRPTVSRAFQNSKALSHAGLHMAFVAVLKKCQGDQETDAACFAALRKLACNDKLCIELGEAGVVLIALKVLQGCITQCATAACGLLRQMAGSDAMKQQIFESSGLEVLQCVLESHVASASCMEAGLGLLAAVALRQAEISAAAIKAGLPETVLQVMQVQQQQWVQRQACIALRNLVARCKDQQGIILGLGAEEAIRAAKQAFPASCSDVGSAALRDLGCDDYNQ